MTLSLLVLATSLGGCEVDSFLFDQSKTGRFEFYPTTIPVLDRIDVIEQEEDYFAQATPVQAEDLLPRELVYFIFPGDMITLGIFELYQQGIWTTVTRRVDAAGNFRVPELGDVRAAGLTAQQFEDEVRRQLAERIMENPQVDVVLEQTGGLRYTVYGYVQEPGVFNLSNPSLRLLDALAIAGGVPTTTERIFVIRQVVLDERIRHPLEPGAATQPQPTRPTEQPAPVDIEDLIEQLENERDRERPSPPNADVRPGMLGALQDTQPMVDVDELMQDEPAEQDQLEPVPPAAGPPPVDVEELRPPAGERAPDDQGGDSFIYVEERGEWVRVPGPRPAQAQPPSATLPGDPAGIQETNLVLDRIIQIRYDRLSRGDSGQNIVIRPNDRIFVEPPLQGLVYIGGEIIRPGVYTLPNIGRLTLSRFIDVAGGFPQTAVPERVDLIREVGHNLEATIRLDLAAIRQRTEPDIYMKPNDHVIIGTSFWATPMAVIRNGFRTAYGFGFLLDRNFGSDVFGAPPERSF